jgi:Mn-dependent DtxR family transcriptional regulator
MRIVFNRGSDSMPSEQVEEYLKTIYDIAGKNRVVRTTEIAKCLKKSPASVTEAIQHMAEKGLVVYAPYKGATLTKEGLIIAIKIKRKHRLLEVFLTDTLHINKKRLMLKHVRWSTIFLTRRKTRYVRFLTLLLGAHMEAILVPVPCF